MKTLLLVLSLSLACVAADAANLTASVINAGTGKKNGKIALSVTGGNAPYTFSWSGPGGYAASWQNPDSLGAGTYCVTVTDRYCGVAEMCVTINEVPNSIHEQSLAEVKVFPNPFGDQLHIRLAEVSAGAIHACLSDASGRIVASRDFASGKEFDWALQHSLPAGTYLLMLRPEGGEASYTMVVHAAE